jgi:hypothetical protein
MPKKQTTKKKSQKSKLPFAHPTKHGSLHWKKLLFIVLYGAFGLVIVAAVVAQMFYNKYLWDVTYQQGFFQTRSMIVDAIKGIDDSKSTLDTNNRIPEVKLQLPEPTTEVSKLKYYYEKGNPTLASEFALPIPESVEITTQSISSIGISGLYTYYDGYTYDDLFDSVPFAQACNRGFQIQFEAFSDNDTGVKTKKLNDGRTLHLQRELGCNGIASDQMDALESYLLQAQSY